MERVPNISEVMVPLNESLTKESNRLWWLNLRRRMLLRELRQVRVDIKEQERRNGKV